VVGEGVCETAGSTVQGRRGHGLDGGLEMVWAQCMGWERVWVRVCLRQQAGDSVGSMAEVGET